MSQISQENNQCKEVVEEIPYQKELSPQKKQRKNSSTLSDSESFISNLNAEIKHIIENDEDLSFSSNSDLESPDKKSDIEYLLDSRFWKASKISSYETDYDQEKIFEKKKSKNEKEKKGKKEFEESNKQSTQENEEDELRYDHLHNISSTESNNSRLNSLPNNESSENNEINCDKNYSKNEKNESHILISNYKENALNKEENQKTEINNNNIKSNNNLLNTNILLNGSNFTNNINFKNTKTDSKFVYPYEQMNLISNASNTNYYQNSYISQNYMNFSSKYNLPSPLNTRNIISLNNNNIKINKILNEKNIDNSEQNVKNENINGQNNKLVNSTNNDLSKKINPNQKDMIDLPLILNQNSTQNIPMNYSIPKLNLNMTYYPKIQNRSIQFPKQSLDKSSSSNLLPELKDSHNNNINTNNNNKSKTNTTIEQNNNNSPTNNTNNNYNNYQNIKMKTSFNTIFNKNNNNNTNNNNIKGQKGEKQFINLEDIANGKDTRTTIMIRNIPIKYTDEILNETFKDFHGKYDCLYMPYDYEKNGNKGYAFINFVNPLHILLFYEKFNGKKWMHFESSKICELNMAHFQGVNEIQKHAKNFKGLKKNCSGNNNENIIIPSKYLTKFKNRFPNMKYENKNKKEFVVKSFE
jgi:hypothetical protein